MLRCVACSLCWALVVVIQCDENLNSPTGACVAHLSSGEFCGPSCRVKWQWPYRGSPIADSSRMIADDVAAARYRILTAACRRTYEHVSHRRDYARFVPGHAVSDGVTDLQTRAAGHEFVGPHCPFPPPPTHSSFTGVFITRDTLWVTVGRL